MNISKQTLEILKNFSTINPSIVIREGNEIATMSNFKDIIAYATVPEVFGAEVGIYDLNEFIATMNLFENPDLKLGETHMVISDGASRCTYGYADSDIIVSPGKSLAFPGGDVKFVLTKDVFERIMRASSTLGLQFITVTRDDKNNIILKAIDNKNQNSNAFSIVVGTDDRPDVTYNFIFPASALKMIRGDYNVAISRKFIAQFSTDDLTYYVAVEKSSTSEFSGA